MSRVLQFSCLFVLLFGCSSKHVFTGALDPSLRESQTCKVAILPLLFSGPGARAAIDRDRAYKYLVARLEETGRFQAIDQSTVQRAIEVREFGPLDLVDPSTAREFGRELGADMVCLADVTLHQPAPGAITMARVQLLGVGPNTPGYSGTGQAANPPSSIAGAVTALELATDELLTKLEQRPADGAGIVE